MGRSALASSTHPIVAMIGRSILFESTDTHAYDLLERTPAMRGVRLPGELTLAARSCGSMPGMVGRSV